MLHRLHDAHDLIVGNSRGPTCPRFPSHLAAIVLALLACPALLMADEGEKSPATDMDAAEASSGQMVKDEIERRRLKRSLACGGGLKLDPFEIWKDVTGTEDARRLLLRHYKLLGSVEKMDGWLECQGFSSWVITGKVGSFPDAPEAEKRLSFSFNIKEHGGRRLWPLQFPWVPVRGILS